MTPLSQPAPPSEKRSSYPRYPPGKFVEGKAEFASYEPSKEGAGGVYKIQDIKSGETTRQIEIPGQFKNASPDFKFIAYLDDNKNGFIKNTQTGETVKLGTKMEDFSVTFRANTGTLVDWRQNQSDDSESHKLVRYDLESLQTPPRLLAETGNVDEVKKNFNQQRAGAVGMGRTIRTNPYSEMYQPIGKSGLAVVDGRVFDETTGQFSGKLGYTADSEYGLGRGSCGNFETFYRYPQKTEKGEVNFIPKISTLIPYTAKGEKPKTKEEMKADFLSADPLTFIRAVEKIANKKNPNETLDGREKDALEKLNEPHEVGMSAVPDLINNLGLPSYPDRKSAFLKLQGVIERASASELPKLQESLKAARSAKDAQIASSAAFLHDAAVLRIKGPQYELARVRQAREILSTMGITDLPGF